MKVLRSTLVAAVAVIAAACGDKVNVLGPGSTGNSTPDVTAIAVSPTAATLSIGQTVNFVAAATVVNGAASTVTWSSSDASKVSVSATGTATAVAATPGVAVCATSTVNANTKGCATVVVSAASQIVPATVSIQSITVNGNINTTVNPAATAGVIDIRANVAPGTETITKIVALVGTTRADSQTFSAAQSAALRFAADEAIANQSAFPPVLFSINTAKFNATTGAPVWVNGNYNIAVQLYTSASATAARSTATYQTALTFANANTYVLTTSTTGASATSAAGFAFKSGSINASVLPVIFTPGITMASGTITFGVAGCDQAVGPRTAALVAPTTGSAWTATFTLANYEFRPGVGACAAVLGTGEGFAVTAASNLGNAFMTAAAAANAAANTYRMDNFAPAAPVVNANTGAATAAALTPVVGSMPNGRALNWINDAVAFNGLASSAAAAALNAGAGISSNGFICDNASAFNQNNCPAAAGFNAALTGTGAVAQNTAGLFSAAAPTDLGVGSVTYSMAVAQTTTAATAAAAATLTSAASLAPAATNATYCGVAYSADALGNKSAANPTGATSTTCAGWIAAGNLNVVTFGVDRAPPTIAWDVTSMAANARINVSPLGGNFVVTVADTGAVGNSGMLPTVTSSTSGPVLYLLSSRTATTTSTLTAAGAASTATAPRTTGVAYAAPLGSTAINTQPTVGAAAAYWTATVYALDAAGNASATLTRVVAGDNNAAVATTPSVPATITGAYSAASFLNDNLSIRDYYFTVGFGGALTAPATITIASTPTAVDAYNAPTFNNTNYALNATINTYLALQNGTTTPPTAYAAGAYPQNALNLFARDQTQAAYTAATPAVVAATAPASGVSVTNFTGAYAIATSNATICAGTLLAGCGATPTSTTLTVTATGATGTFNNPFSRVDLYGSNGTDLVLITTLPAASATLVDNGATRVWTYTYTLTGAAANTLLGNTVTRNIYAFGANSTGTVALVSAAAAQTINP